MTNGKPSLLPPILELAERIRNGETGEAIANQYDLTIDTLRNRFSRAGFSVTNGRATTNTTDREPLTAGMVGTGGNYVGGGDWDRGLPTGDRPIVHRNKPRNTGLNWAAIDAEYEVNQGVRKDGIWDKRVKITGGKGRHGVHTYAEAQPVTELAPAPAAPIEVEIPEGLDDVDPMEILAGQTYDEPELLTDEGPVEEPATNKGGRPRAFTNLETAQIVQRYKRGESTTDLAAAYGSNHATIWRTLVREGVQLRKQGPPAATGRTTAFTAEQEADIVHRYKLGESAQTIATSYNQYATAVRRVLLRNDIPIRSRAQAAAIRHNPGLAPSAESDGNELIEHAVISGGLTLPEGDQPLPVKNNHPDIQSMVIADIEARRPAQARHSHPGHDYLELLYHGLIDALLDLKQALNQRDRQAQP